MIVCGRYRGTKSLDGVPVDTRGLNDGFVARYANNGSTLAWLKTFGGSLEDECTSIAVGPNGDIVMAVNHASGKVSIDSSNLANPPVTGQEASAIVRLRATGEVVWVRDLVSAGPSHIARTVFGTNGDVFYAGFGTGTLDLGGGPLDAGPGPTFFVARRGL